jgi:hypothetical protein
MEIAGALVHTNDHVPVHVVLVLDEHAAPLLRCGDPEGVGCA